MVVVKPETEIVHEMDNTFGVLFIGYIIAMVMYGLTFFRGSPSRCFHIPLGADDV
jgi:hypothetical protein